MVLSLEPTKWLDAIESSPECLCSHESAKNVEHVLSKTSTRKHQQLLMKAVEPFLEKMLKDCAGISILTSLVKYGTVATVNELTKSFFSFCDADLNLQNTLVDKCRLPLGILVERIVYREDCTQEFRMKLISFLKSRSYSSLVENCLLVLAVARLIKVDASFAIPFCADLEAQKAFLQLYSTPGTRDLVLEFCTILLAEEEKKNKELKDKCSRFIFDAFTALYTKDSPICPPTKVTVLLAQYGEDKVVYDLAKCMLLWSDLPVRSQKEDYATAIAFILERLNEKKVGATLVKRVFQSNDDVDKRMNSRKVSHLHLLASVGENSVYVSVLTKAFGALQEKKLRGAAVMYRNATKPKSIATKDAVLQKIAKLRAGAKSVGTMNKSFKRGRE